MSNKRNYRNSGYNPVSHEVYKAKERAEAEALAKKFNFKIVPNKIGESLTFNLKSGRVSLSLSIQQKNLFRLATRFPEAGQLTVWIEDHVLKNDMEMVYNNNNIGEHPGTKAWDNTPIPTAKRGEKIRINAVEYGAGDGGTFYYGKFRRAMTKAEASSILTKYRKILIDSLIGVEADEILYPRYVQKHDEETGVWNQVEYSGYLDHKDDKVGTIIRQDVGAPGIGHSDYRVTRVTEEGVHAVLVFSNVRILDPSECI